MRALRRPPSRDALRRASREHGKPVAALAIIASIFATALVIKLLPPATRHAVLLVAEPELPSRSLPIWSESQQPISSTANPQPEFTATERSVPVIPAAPPPVEPRGEVVLTFDRDPGEAPLLQFRTPMPLEIPAAATAVPAVIQVGNSPFVAPFTRTGSALRVAFVKTGSAIKAAASGTAGVFVSNP